VTTTARRRTDGPTVKELALNPKALLQLPQPQRGGGIRAVPDNFDLMVVGEIVEQKNESMAWWDTLPPSKQQSLYLLQIEQPPRRQS